MILLAEPVFDKFIKYYYDVIYREEEEEEDGDECLLVCLCWTSVWAWATSSSVTGS